MKAGARRQNVPAREPRIEVFVRHYLVDMNAARAARAAGYAAEWSKTRAKELLQDPDVQALLEERRARMLELLDIKLEDVLRELSRLAFSNIGHVATWDGRTVVALDQGDIPEDALPAIKEIVRLPDGSMRIKMHDKTAALLALGKHLGLKDTSRLDHAVADGAPLAVRLIAAPTESVVQVSPAALVAELESRGSEEEKA